MFKIIIRGFRSFFRSLYSKFKSQLAVGVSDVQLFDIFLYQVGITKLVERELKARQKKTLQR